MQDKISSACYKIYITSQHGKALLHADSTGACSSNLLRLLIRRFSRWKIRDDNLLRCTPWSPIGTLMWRRWWHHWGRRRKVEFWETRRYPWTDNWQLENKSISSLFVVVDAWICLLNHTTIVQLFFHISNLVDLIWVITTQLQSFCYYQTK